MLKRTIAIFALLLICISIGQANINVFKQYFNKYSISKVNMRDSLVIVGCYNNFSNTKQQTFFVLDGTQIDTLSLNNSLTGAPESIYCSPWIHIVDRNEFYSIGEVSNTEFVYHYKNKSYETIFFEDTSSSSIRDISFMALGTRNNLWVFSTLRTELNSIPYQFDIHLLVNNKLNHVYSSDEWMAFIPNIDPQKYSSAHYAALPDGSIAIHQRKSRKVMRSGDINDFLFLNPDGSYEEMELMPRNQDTVWKPVCSIYAESKNNFYVAYGFYTIYNPNKPDPQKEIYWHTGLVRYRDGEWTYFDKSNGLPGFRNQADSVMCPVWAVTKVNNRLFVKTSQGIYYSDDEINFSKLDLTEIINGMVFFKNKETTPDSLIYSTLDNLYKDWGTDKYSNHPYGIEPNGSFVIREDQFFGLSKIKPNASIATESNEDILLVHPNPTVDYIFLSDDYIDAQVFIYNSNGERMMRINYSPEGINCSGLNSGAYNLCVLINNKLLVTKFIKK